MKTGRLFPMFILGLCMVFLPPSALAGINILYTFDDGKGPNFIFDNPTGLFTLDDTHRELRLTKPTDTLDPTLRLGRVRSLFKLIGNFDIRVDYKINQPLSDGDQQEFQLYSKTFNYFISRSNEVGLGGNNCHVYYNDNFGQPGVVIPGVTTQDTEGTLRFVRQGNVITAFFKSAGDSQYTVLDSHVLNGDPVSLGMVLQNQPKSHTALDASFDNLSILADGWRFKRAITSIFSLLLLEYTQ
jgi:hypothetical protein